MTTPELKTELPVIAQDAPDQAEQGPTFERYDTQLKQLVNDFDREEKPRCETRRKLRQNRKNIEQMRTDGELLADETYIADRTIETNIERESVPYIRYLEQSRRLLIFKPKKHYEQVAEPEIRNLEACFTTGMRYQRWKLPWFKIVDGITLHGANPVEVVFDESKPLHSGIEYVPRTDMIIPLKTVDVQTAEYVLRRYELFTGDFEAKAKALGFDAELTKELVSPNKEKRTERICFFRAWIKFGGIVYIAWWVEGKSKWLKAPEPLQMGLFDIDREFAASVSYDVHAIQQGPFVSDNNPLDPEAGHNTPPTPTPLTIYPLFYPKYRETEDDEVVASMGRASKDQYVQDGIGSMMSSVVNGARRASNLYGSKAPNAGDGATGEVLGPIKHGHYVDGNIAFWAPPYPNPLLIQVASTLSTRNSSQAGQVDYAAMNRQDSNKTATELVQAKEAAQALSSAPLSVFSTHIQEAYSFCWDIARSQALIDEDVYLTPNKALLFIDYHLTPAGDTEVVERAEKEVKFREYWPEIKQTPMAGKFFDLMIENAFPTEAATLLAEKTSVEQNKSELLAAAGQILAALPMDTLNASPDERSRIENLVAAIQAVAPGPDDTSRAQSPQAPPFPVAPASNVGGAQ